MTAKSGNARGSAIGISETLSLDSKSKTSYKVDGESRGLVLKSNLRIFLQNGEEKRLNSKFFFNSFAEFILLFEYTPT